MLCDADCVQPFASVTVTEYVPGPRLVIESTVAAVDHKKLYPGAPPEAMATMLASFAPLQLTLEGEVVTTMSVGSLIVTFVESEHPLASVTVTEYVPAERLVIDAVVDAVLQA